MRIKRYMSFSEKIRKFIHDHSRQLSRISLIMLAVIVLALIYFIQETKERRRISEEKYQIACDYLDSGEYTDAVAVFDEIKGYKDADALRAYADVSFKVIHFVATGREFEEPEVLRNELKAIPDNYNGKYKDKILKLRQYMENEYDHDYNAYLKYKSGICIRDNCNNPVEGTFCFCSEHKCHVKDCKFGAIEGRQYCARHPGGIYGNSNRPVTNPAATTNNASSKRQSSYSNSSSNSQLDVSDVDVEAFYNDHKSEFSSMDDAEDYLDDYPDEWDE